MPGFKIWHRAINGLKRKISKEYKGEEMFLRCPERFWEHFSEVMEIGINKIQSERKEC